MSELAWNEWPGDPTDLWDRLEEQNDREHEATLALKEALDRGVSSRAIRTLCAECGIPLDTIQGHDDEH